MLRCLLVDDSAGFLAAASTLLEREGLDVVGTASTGAEALEQAERFEPDVALVDINLGDENGFELARLLVDHRRPAAPQVIMVSTHSGDEFADLIEASPAAGFVHKSELSARAVLDVLGGADDGRIEQS